MKLQDGTTHKLGIPGNDGAVTKNWPLSTLSLDWIRTYFARFVPASFQAAWLVADGGKLLPRGRSRVVEIFDVHPPKKHAAGIVAMGNNTIRQLNGPGAPAPDIIPSQLIDAKIKFVEEIATMRLAAQKEIFGQQLAAEREIQESRSRREREELEARIEALEDTPSDGEDDEWGWLKDLAREFAPALKAALPAILQKLGVGAS